MFWSYFLENYLKTLTSLSKEVRPPFLPVFLSDDRMLEVCKVNGSNLLIQGRWGFQGSHPSYMK